ncbi:hypothetical protein ACQV2S_00910 [Facklamia sp. P13064]|uniref:hypothetical protein n=1 Tax=Facklamia sp. P13064 TaxID=3421953 RepID=UPI003D176295
MNLKKSLIVGASILIMAPVISTGFTTLNVLANERVQEQVSSVKESGNIDYSEFVEVYKDGDTTIATISDDNVVKLFKKNGFDLIEESSDESSVSMTPYRLETNLTRVVKHGNGSYDVYLSSKTLNRMRAVGAFGTSTILGGLFGSLTGGAAGGYIADIVSDIFEFDNIKHGKVFVIRDYAYQYWYHQ